MEKKEMKGGVFNECLLMNIFPTGCLLGQGGDGGSKITKNVWTSFMDGPIQEKL